MNRAATTAEGQDAVLLYNDVQLMHEMHWSYDDLFNTPEDVVWATSYILNLQAEKQEDDMRREERRRR